MFDISKKFNHKKVEPSEIRWEKTETMLESYKDWRQAFVMSINGLCEETVISEEQRDLLFERATDIYEALQSQR